MAKTSLPDRLGLPVRRAVSASQNTRHCLPSCWGLLIKSTPFGIATNREWVAGPEKKSLAEYHNITAWGKLAEICGKYLKKGKLVYIEGYLKTRSWDSPEGVKIFRTEIVATDMIMLDKKEQGGDEIDDFMFDDQGFNPEE